ncbi:hypothetical protein BH18ACI2_BH18ACI2_19530 [soil metagenome]|jgi:transposase
MIQLPPQLQIMLALSRSAFAKGIDTLSALCRNRLNHDPFSSTVFLFRNRRATALKLLIYDGQGFCCASSASPQGVSRNGRKPRAHRCIL